MLCKFSIILLGFWLHSVHILSYVCFGNLHRVECTRKIFHCTSDTSSWDHHAVSDIRPAVINDTAPHARITDICICLVLLYKSDFNDIKYTWNIRLLFWVVWIIDSLPTHSIANNWGCPSSELCLSIQLSVQSPEYRCMFTFFYPDNEGSRFIRNVGTYL